MKKKLLYKILSFVTAGCIMLTATPVYAAGADVTITVGTQFVIPGSDIKPGNTVSAHELENDYATFVESQSSNSTDIDSNVGDYINSNLPNQPQTANEAIKRGQTVSNPTLTYEEFMKLIGNMSSEQQDAYEKAVQKNQNTQDKNNKEAEKIIKMLHEVYTAEAKKGVDGNNCSGSDGIYKILNWYAEQTGNKGKDINEILDDYMKKLKDNVSQTSDSAYKARENQIKNIENEYNKNKNYKMLDMIDHVEVSDADKNNNTLEWVDNQPVYRCGKCGKTFSFSTHCDCGKMIYCKNYTDSIDHVDHYGDSDDDVVYSYKGNTSLIVCTYCQKAVLKTEIEDFVIQDNGLWACKECYYNTGGTEKYGYTDGSLSFTPAEEVEADDYMHIVGVDGLYGTDTYESQEHTVNTAEAEKQTEQLKEMFDYVKSFADTPFPENVNDWTDKDDENFKKTIEEAYDNGVPSSEDQPENTEKVSDSTEYEEYVRKVFPDWPADQSKWTEKQKQIYQEYCEKYGHSEIIDQMDDAGVFDEDKDAQDRLEALDKFKAGYTTINDNIKTTLVIDYDDTCKEAVSEEKSVIGLGSFKVVNSAGETVAYNDSWDKSSRCCWQASDVGSYTVKRTVSVYDVTYKAQKITGHIKWVVDGMEDMPIYDKEFTKVRIDDSGNNYRNERKVNASDIHVRVVEGNMDLSNVGDFATERIR